MKQVHFLILFSLVLSQIINAQQIDPDAPSDWTKVGYARENTIPRAFDHIINVKTIFGLKGDNSADDATLLQQAINKKGELYGNQFVVFYFPQGTYRLDNTITIPLSASKLVFIGEGSSSTIFRATHSGIVFKIESANQPGLIPVPTGNYLQYNRGNNNITVPFTGVQQNDFLEIQIKDGSWHGNYHPRNTYPVEDYYVGQIVEIASIISANGSETQLTLKDKLRLNYGWEFGIGYGDLEPKVQKLTTVNNIGFENFSIVNDGATGDINGYNFRFNYAVNCWIWGVLSEKPYRAHVNISRSSGIEIRGCYFYSAKEFGGGGEGYGITINTHSTNCLVEDNVFYYLRHAMMVQSGANGNVFGFNFSGDQPTGGLMEGIDNGDISFHGLYPYDNLFEGNMALFADADRFWGSNGPRNTIFRNQLRRSPDNACFNLYNTTNYPLNNGGIRILGPYVNGLWQQQNFYILGNTIQRKLCSSEYQNATYFTDNESQVDGYNYPIDNVNGGYPDTAPLSGISMYYINRPPFLPSNYTWPPVGCKQNGNTVNPSQNIPARQRFFSETIKTSSSTPYTGELVVTTNIEIEQKRENTVLMTGSIVSHWEGNTFQNYIIQSQLPSFSFPSGTLQTFRGQQIVISSPDEKYNQWVRNIGSEPDVSNHHTFTIKPSDNKFTAQFKNTYNATIQSQLLEGGNPGGIIEFKDPWLIDYPDPSYNNNFRNQGMSAPFKSVAYSVNNLGIETAYKGVFLNQFYSGENYYSVSAPSPQTINGIPSYFLNWGGSNVTFQNPYAQQTGVVFTAANATAVANYKAISATSTATGFASGSQRKIARTNNGALYLVYESVGAVWFQRSDDNGATWYNIEKVADNSKQPSLALWGNKVVIAYQKKDETAYKIAARVCSSSGSLSDEYIITPNAINSYTDAAQVVAGINPEGQILFVWRQTTASGNAGLYFSGGTMSSTGYIPHTTNKIGYTSSSSSSPSIGSPLVGDNNAWYHYPLVWSEGSQIYFKDIEYRPNSAWQNTGATGTSLSSGSGYSSNYNPSVVAVSSTGARVSWVGSRWVSGGQSYSKAEAGGGGGGYYEYKTLFRDPSETSFWSFGSNVQTANIGINQNDNGYIIAWTRNDNANYYTKNSSLGGNIYQFTKANTALSGKDVQVIPGTSWGNMYGMVLDPSSAPYRLKQSDNITSLAKTATAPEIFKGRQGTVTKENAEFYFLFGDISVNGAAIDFEEIPHTAKVDTLPVLNQYLTTKPFTLENRSDFVYDVQYGFVDSTAALSALQGSNSVNFKVQLLDEANENILGEYDNITFKQNSVLHYSNIQYQVNTEGIGAKTVRLRLVVTASPDVDCSIIQSTDLEPVTGLGKNSARRKQISYKGVNPVTEYALNQNYPNPFNPSTTIDYQIPKDGHVMMKVYDILGKEVATLVNEEKPTGRYTVTFDGSHLASGTYIVRMISRADGGSAKDEFVKTMKVMLMK